MYKAYVLLAEDYWEIELLLSQTKTKEEAKKAVDSVNAFYLVEVDGISAIQTCLESQILYYFDKDVAIKEISQTKRNQLGRPLNPTNKNDRDIAYQALLTQDPAYFISEGDMVLSNKKLSDLLARYGAGRSLDYSAYRISRM